MGSSFPHVSSCPNTPQTKAIFSTQLKHEPSMCMVAPRGMTISATSRLMPVSSAASRLAGMVATDEQVPRDVRAGRVKTMNESIYYNIDKLHSAIGEGKQIRFQYFQWTVEKKEALRRDGGWYCVSPWHLRWDDENYYLIAYDAEADRVKHYRVDKMKRITLLEAPRLGQERMARFDPAVYTRRLFGMYGGQPVRVTLEGENEMVGVLIDRFGKEVPVLPVDGARFQAFVDVAVSPQFLGWVAGLGGGLRIVSPEPVVQKMQALVQRLAEQYCAPDGDKTSV